MWAQQRLRPGCCLIQPPRPPGRESAGRSWKRAPKPPPSPGCLVCAAHGAAQSSPTKDWTRIQVCCLSKQDRVREDTTALRDCCLALATQHHETSLGIMSREHKGDGYWTVANVYKQKGEKGDKEGNSETVKNSLYQGKRSTDGENARAKAKAERNRKIQRE